MSVAEVDLEKERTTVEYLEIAFCYYFIKSDVAQRFSSEWISFDEYTIVLKTMLTECFDGHDINVNTELYIEDFAEFMSHAESDGLIVFEGDEFTGIHFKLRNVSPHPAARMIQLYPLYERIRTLGPSSLTNALLAINSQREALAKDGSRPAIESFADEIPAADRIVLRSDNQRVASEVDEILGEIESSLISGSNELGSAFGDDLEVAASEVGWLKAAAQKARIRVGSILPMAKQTLGWIIEKAGSATIADIAKRGLALIIKWLDFN